MPPNAETAQQLWPHQQYEKSLRRLSDINHMRAAGSPSSRLGRAIMLRLCSSRRRSVPGAVKTGRRYSGVAVTWHNSLSSSR